MQPSLIQDANRMLEETTELFPESAEAWSLYGQVPLYNICLIALEFCYFGLSGN